MVYDWKNRKRVSKIEILMAHSLTCIYEKFWKTKSRELEFAILEQLTISFYQVPNASISREYEKDNAIYLLKLFNLYSKQKNWISRTLTHFFDVV